ncbi:hypothetical protein HHI36_003889 [Cryptolaemus montrouzieri]|uniref:CCAAT-binding factor domain-containing protein n=1 Tax=Cryptolaemus montrouzieri TaxID=559131 RepID=A0ABD2NPJ1_9CUCU
MQLNKSVDILLNSDNSFGDGNNMIELDDPEYSNASSTSLYELTLLKKHYHPIVGKFARNIASGAPSSGEGNLVPEIGKLNADDLFNNYDMTEMSFNPSVPVPKKTQLKTKISSYTKLADSSFEDYLKSKMKDQLKCGVICIE